MFTADVKTTCLNAYMKDGDVVHAEPPPAWQPQTLAPSRITWSRSSGSAASSRTCLTLACGLTGRSEYRSCSTWTTYCWLEHTKVISELLTELSPDLQLKSSEVTTKPTRYLGRTLVKTKDGYNIGVDAACAESTLEEFNMSALKNSPTLRWEHRETDEKEMPASERGVYRQLAGKLLRIDRADLRCAMVEASLKSWTDWAGDADRLSVSGSASWVKDKLG